MRESSCRAMANQSLMQIRIPAETLGALDEPEIQLVFQSADIGDEFSRVAFGIVHQVAGMHLEKSSQQHARRIGQMRPRAALDLREIRSG